VRRIVISVWSLVAVAVAFLCAAPAAFATTIAPAGGGTPVKASGVGHHSGLTSWEVLLVVAAGVVLVAAVGAVVFWLSRRSVSKLAVH
jgi:hypothetical protein